MGEQQALAALHDKMDWYVDQSFLPCVETIILKDLEVIDRHRSGYLDLDAGSPLPEDAIYRMYSNSKLVTTVAVMMLVERGLVQLDDPIAQYLPAFANPQVLKADAQTAADVEPAAGPILVRHALSHTAGWSYGFIEPFSLIDSTYLQNGLDVFGMNDVSLAELCDRLAEQPLAYQPGTRWRYSLATDVCARLVEVVSGQAFDDFLEAEIFAPLKMPDTGFWVPKAKRDRFIAMYAPVDLLDPTKPGLNRADDPQTGLYTQHRRFKSGGGGLVSTVADTLSFMRLLANGGEWDGVRLLQPETLVRMRQNECAAGVGVSFPMWDMPGTTFGLGLALKSTLTPDEPATMAGEFHWGGMAGTHTWIAPEANLIGICMTQLMPGFWHPFSHDFKDAVYALGSG
ncbi:MAG: serine hydrolase domain-containing protein [Pseudomonadota bacterium]